ncbi:MAG: DUF5990 family protein [Pseudonocardia sp.]
MRVRIHGHHLPGATCGAYHGVQVGLQWHREVVELHPADVEAVTWEFDADVQVRPDGTPVCAAVRPPRITWSAG